MPSNWDLINSFKLTFTFYACLGLRFMYLLQKCFLLLLHVLYSNIYANNKGCGVALGALGTSHVKEVMQSYRRGEGRSRSGPSTVIWGANRLSQGWERHQREVISESPQWTGKKRKGFCSTVVLVSHATAFMNSWVTFSGRVTLQWQ